MVVLSPSDRSKYVCVSEDAVSTLALRWSLVREKRADKQCKRCPTLANVSGRKTELNGLCIPAESGGSTEAGISQSMVERVVKVWLTVVKGGCSGCALRCFVAKNNHFSHLVVRVRLASQ